MPDGPSNEGIERLLRALVARERLANTAAGAVGGRYEDLFRRIERVLRRIDPPGAARARYRAERVVRLVNEVERVLREFTPEIEALTKDLLAPIGRAEALRAHADLLATLGTTNADLVSRTTPVTQARMRAILNSDPFRGRTLREHSRRISANVLDRVRSQVRIGMAAEEGIPQIVRRVRGTWVRPGGAYGFARREAEAMVRTAVTFVSNEGMMETFRENAEVVGAVRFTSALDDRTTALCLSLDGTEWPLDSGAIQTPPLHYNCRSVLVPVVAWDRLGLVAPPEPERVVRDMSTVADEDLGRRVSARRRTGDFGAVERIPSSTVAEQWFREQRGAVQNRIVGPARAEMYRRGQIRSLRELIAGDNTLIPLDRLREN